MSHDDYPWAQPVRRGPAPTSPLVPLLTLVGAVALVIGAILLFRAVWDRGPVGRDPTAEAPPIAPRGDLTEIEKTNIRVYEENKPSVVHITTLTVRSSLFSVSEVPEGTGSGFIWDDKGHIVTNFHVIKDAEAARVTLSDQTTYKAWYVGGAPDKDLAVLWIQAPQSKLRPIKQGTSNDLKVGQLVYAIGNPFGLDQTLTTGVVSALGREIESVVRGRRIKDVIQTDASINPGNSGGPLLDSWGRLIGVNTAIYSPSGSSAGIGFAIPVDEVRQVVPELIRTGKTPQPEKTTRPGLGIQYVRDEDARELGVQQGVVIARVMPGSAAGRAGLIAGRLDERGRPVLGDVIVGIDDKPVNSIEDLFAILKQCQVGQTVTVHLLRGSERTQKRVTLGAVQ